MTFEKWIEEISRAHVAPDQDGRRPQDAMTDTFEEECEEEDLTGPV